MLVLSCLVGITVCLDFFFRQINQQKHKKYYCIAMFIVFTFVMGFRSRYTAGVDTDLVYIPVFQRLIYSPMSDVLDTYLLNEPLFYIGTKLITFVTTDYRIYILLIAIIVMASVCIFIYRYSPYPVMSFILFCSLGYFGIECQMLRHALAVSVLLFSYPFIEKKQPLRFFALVLIASCFHTSAIVFALAYIAPYLKIGWKQWIACFALVGLCFVLHDQVSAVVNTLLLQSERFSSHAASYVQAGEMGLGGMIMAIAIWVTAQALMKNDSKESITNRILFNMGVLSVVFVSMVSIVGEFHRIAMFFGMSFLLLLPRAFDECKIRDPRIVYGLTLFALAAYFLFIGAENNMIADFQFFWDE